jgi:hypothetical protein
MKEFDLESKIKSVRVPERDGEFWQTLPQRVLAKAQTAPAPDSHASTSSPLHSSLFNILNSKFIMAVLAAAFCLWQTRLPQAVSHRLLQDERQMRQTLAQLPGRLDTLMHDEHGLHSLVQDPP